MGYKIPKEPVKEEPVPTPHEAVWRGLPKKQAQKSVKSRQTTASLAGAFVPGEDTL